MNKVLSKFFDSTTILIAFSVLYFIMQFNVSTVYAKYFGVYDPREIPIFAFFVFYTLFWFLLLPALTNKIFFGENVKEMGLVLPANKKLTLILIIVALLILIPWILYFTQMPQFHGYSLANLSLPKFIFMLGVLFPGYYLGEEFFFRGFLFLGLWKRIGWHSFWLTDVIFTVLHLGKPGLEILLCIPASIVFNALTLFTRSIYPAVLVHSTLGMVMSVFVTYNIKF